MEVAEKWRRRQAGEWDADLPQMQSGEEGGEPDFMQGPCRPLVTTPKRSAGPMALWSCQKAFIVEKELSPTGRTSV